MQTVRTAHDQMLDGKRAEILETVRQCMEATHTAADGNPKAMDIIRKSDTYFDGYKTKINECKSIALLDLKHNMHENILYWETLFAHNEKSCRYIPLRHLQKLICFCTRFETLFS